MSLPNGMLDVLEGTDLYEISYGFGAPGTYQLCVIETVPCVSGRTRFENWWLFEVAGDD